jgi:hypothetical protein
MSRAEIVSVVLAETAVVVAIAIAIATVIAATTATLHSTQLVSAVLKLLAQPTPHNHHLPQLQ